jgi:DNA polymerase-1
MSNLVFDIEADGLKPTKIFCIVAQDVDTKEVFTYGPDEIKEGIQKLQEAAKLIGHNILGYDLPVIHKLEGVDLQKEKRIIDTLVLSRLFNPTREKGHGLETWGTKLGFNKIDFHDFDEYTEDMMTYCIRDVNLNLKVYNSLRVESKGFDRRAMDLEHDVYKIIMEQIDNGFKLNVKYAMTLVAELTEKIRGVETQVHKTFLPKITTTKLKAVYTKTKSLSTMAQVVGEQRKVRLSDEEKQMLASNPIMIIERKDATPFNLGSRKQIGEYLIEFGWKPTKLTPTGQPIVDEVTLGKVRGIPEAQLIAEYLTLQKRIAQITSWLAVVTDEERVHGYVNSNGTITGRMTHSKPNMAQIPASHSPYGRECRSCWTVERGNKLVGIDASGLELRMLAHYMNDEDYIDAILNGDIHTSNQKLAGLESRNQAKTFIYALLYGAGDAKLGTVVGGGRQHGKKLRERFLNNLPAYANLKDRVARASKKSFVKGLDGRKLFVRSEHSALNTLLQGAGAIVMKEALVIFKDLLDNVDYDVKFVANVHDEYQIEVAEQYADEAGKLGVRAIQLAGESLKLRCALDGEYNVGNNWAETH